VIGTRQALEAVKIITGIGTPLSGVVLMVDTLDDREFRMKLKPVPENLRIEALQDEYEAACESVSRIDSRQLPETMSTEKAALWDVRQPAEFAVQHLRGASSVPLETLVEAAAQLDATKPLVVYCQRGGRSDSAARTLRELRPELRVFSLRGGIEGCPADLYAV
jgi:adenylyltransferase/sulfurtransferase